MLNFLKKLFSSKPKKTEPKERVTDLMNKLCVCSHPCNEFCADSKSVSGILPTTEKLKSIKVNNPKILSQNA